MINNNFQIAIVGFGGMGNWHRELMADVQNLDLCGIYDIREKRCELAREHGLRVYSSFEEILQDETVDIVLCATPNDVHKDITVRALRAGKNVICEKPAAMSSAEYEEMMAVAAETGRLLVVHQNRRWDEDYLTVRKILQEKMLGDVFKIESRVHGSRGIPGDWRQEKEHGGGMLLDWGVHILDQALQMIPGKVKHIYATFTNVTNELVDDGFTAELTFENGLRFALEVGTSNFIELPRWYVLGNNGSAIVENWDLSGKVVNITDWSKNDAVPIRTAAGLTKTMAPRTKDTIRTDELPIVRADVRDYYRNVMDAIAGKAPILVENEEVLRVLRLMEAITRSAESGQAVSFE